MKRLVVIFIAISYCLPSNAQQSLNLKNDFKMKLNAGIITQKIQETKMFYTEVLGFDVIFKNDFYLLMSSPGKQGEISFLLPKHPSQKPIFQKPFSGDGVYLTIEVEDVDRLYNDFLEKGINIVIAIRDEPWGDRHFDIKDRNGIGIDIVKYSPQKVD